MTYGLPTSLEIQGREYEIRADYRAVLDICIALADPELTEQQKGEVILKIFYPAFESIPLDGLQEALEKCFWFINGGDDQKSRKGPRLMDWEQDFNYIVAPINRVLGTEVRAVPYDFKANKGGFHWWSFLAAYMEIGGDCTFAQVVSIRDKLARGKSLDKTDREWMQRNRPLVEFKRKYTKAEDELVKRWT